MIEYIIMNIDIQIYHGENLPNELGILGEFRLRFFKDFPYLYVGTEEEEQKHLSEYAALPSVRLLIARDKDDHEKVAGVAIGTMLSDETEILHQIGKPLQNLRIEPHRCFYFGEMILPHEFRNKGIGKEMLNVLKGAGREQGADRFGFLAVARAADDVRRPAGLVDSEQVFHKFGFVKTDVFVEYKWATIQTNNSIVPTLNRLYFWMDKK